MTKANLVKTAKELNELFGLDPAIDVKGKPAELTEGIAQAISLWEQGDKLSETAAAVLGEIDWDPVMEALEEDEEKDTLTNVLRGLNIWVNEDVPEKETPAEEEKPKKEKKAKKEKKEKPEKEKKPAKKREGKDETIEASTVVKGLKKGVTVTFTTARNYKKAPNTEMTGEVRKVYLSARMGKEAVQIRNESGNFFKVSDSVKIVKAKK